MLPREAGGGGGVGQGSSGYCPVTTPTLGVCFGELTMKWGQRIESLLGLVVVTGLKLTLFSL